MHFHSCASCLVSVVSRFCLAHSLLSLSFKDFGAFGDFVQTYPNSIEWMLEGTDAAMALQTLATNAQETSSVST
jgi:hypothetical protein